MILRLSRVLAIVKALARMSWRAWIAPPLGCALILPFLPLMIALFVAPVWVALSQLLLPIEAPSLTGAELSAWLSHHWAWSAAAGALAFAVGSFAGRFAAARCSHPLAIEALDPNTPMARRWSARYAVSFLYIYQRHWSDQLKAIPPTHSALRQSLLLWRAFPFALAGSVASCFLALGAVVGLALWGTSLAYAFLLARKAERAARAAAGAPITKNALLSRARSAFSRAAQSVINEASEDLAKTERLELDQLTRAKAKPGPRQSL